MWKLFQDLHCYTQQLWAKMCYLWVILFSMLWASSLIGQCCAPMLSSAYCNYVAGSETLYHFEKTFGPSAKLMLYATDVLRNMDL